MLQAWAGRHCRRAPVPDRERRRRTARSTPSSSTAGSPPAAAGVRVERGRERPALTRRAVPHRGPHRAPGVERGDRRVRARGPARRLPPRMAANGLSSAARSAPSRSAYMPALAAPQPVEGRLHGRDDPESGQRGDRVRRRPSRRARAGAGRRGPGPAPSRSAASREPGRHGVERAVADRVEAGLQPGLGAGDDVVAHLRGRQVGVAGVVTRRRRRSRRQAVCEPIAAVGEQVAGRARRRRARGRASTPARARPSSRRPRGRARRRRAPAGRRGRRRWRCPGPPSSCTQPMPSSAARRRVARCAARRCAGVTDSRATRRTTWWASVRQVPAVVEPGLAARLGRRRSSAEDTTAEWTSMRER